MGPHRDRRRWRGRRPRSRAGLVFAGAAPALLREAQDAAVVVLGCRGLRGVAGLLAGSVGVSVTAHAPCPVVVVRPCATVPPGPSAARVVVGVDGCALSADAVDVAFQAAAQRGLGLTAVHAWTPPGPHDLTPSPTTSTAPNRSIDGPWTPRCSPGKERYPGVEVRSKLVRAHPGRALVTESAGAALLVVGSRGRGSLREMVLGSVSQTVLPQAACLVTVVRPRTPTARTLGRCAATASPITRSSPFSQPSL